MTTTNDHGPGCSRWADRLSEHVDGELAPDEAARLEAHLAECARCSAEASELEAVRRAARSLADRPPERDLWPGIADALGPRRTATPPVGSGSRGPIDPGRAPGRRSGLFLTVPQLAAAAVLLLLAGGLGAWSAMTAGASPGPETAGATVERSDVVPAGAAAEIASRYAGEVERLEAILREERGRLDPSTVRVLEKNLEVVDRAIRESVAALEEDPANAWVRDYLRRSWERKVEYLRGTAELLARSDA